MSLHLTVDLLVSRSQGRSGQRLGGNYMLAVNITASMKGKLDARDGSDIRACAEKWWAISNTTLDGYANELMAVAGNEVAGMFTIKDWQRDPAAGDKIVFDLVPAPEWQW